MIVGTYGLRKFFIELRSEKLSDEEEKQRLEQHLKKNKDQMSIQAIAMLEKKIAKY